MLMMMVMMMMIMMMMMMIPFFNMYIYIIRKRDFLSSAAKKRGPRSDRQNLYVRRVLSGEFVQAWWIVRI